MNYTIKKLKKNEVWNFPSFNLFVLTFNFSLSAAVAQLPCEAQSTF